MPPGWKLRSKGNELSELLKRHNLPYRAKQSLLNDEDEDEEDTVDDAGMLSKNSLYEHLKRCGMSFIQMRLKLVTGQGTAFV